MTADSSDESRDPIAYPVYRRGAILGSYTAVQSGAEIQRGDRLVLGYEAINDAIDRLSADKDHYLRAITKALEAEGWRVRTPREIHGLSKFRRNRRVGAVVDHDELEISRGERVYIVRLCVTACIDIDGTVCQGQAVCRAASDENLMYSKFWCRVSCVKWSDANIAPPDQNRLLAFETEAASISFAVIEATKKPYSRSLSELHSKFDPDFSEEIVIDIVYTITNLTFTTKETSFSDYYYQLKLGHSDPLGREQIGDRDLGAIDSVFTAIQETFFQQNDRGTLEVMALDNAHMTSGLYWADVGPETTRLVGIAYTQPSHSQSANSAVDDYSDWRHAPSNTMSVVAASTIASQL